MLGGGAHAPVAATIVVTATLGLTGRAGALRLVRHRRRGVTHVVNFDVPEVPEAYVHRIGRTARAGASGMALTFCDVDERPDFRAIEKLIRQDIPVVEGHPYESRVPFSASASASRGPAPQRPAPQGHSHGRRDLPGGGGGGGGRRRRRRPRGAPASA